MSERFVRGLALKTTPTGNGRWDRQRGFTLVELLVVIVIIAIILSFVLLAASDASRRAEERATQTLINKLEGGLNDRLDALMQNRPDANFAHGYMAQVWNTGFPPSATQLSQARLTDRAQVFAWYDYLKRELPDVFFIQGDTNFPINFAAQQYYPGARTAGVTNGSYGVYVLPMGNSVVDSRTSLGSVSYGDWFEPGTGLAFPETSPTLGFPGAGIYGASYPIAAGVFKNLVVSATLLGGNSGNETPVITTTLPAGYDGVDNNGNNLVDEIGEGTWNLQLLTVNHTHNTARAEMLYALLVEGAGPWGTVFNRDDFTDREVQDTDGDGLLEFVDAWGQPLQFFRWPLFYHSDLQRGQVILPDPNTPNQWDLLPPYQTVNSATPAVNTAGAVFQERERDPLDPNQQLTAPQWWSQTGVGGQLAANNASPFAGMSPAGSLNPAASGGAQAFENFFHKISEPISPGGGVVFWDRGGSFARRAYYSKFLILSGGPDKQPGVFLYADSDMTSMGNAAAAHLIANENNALPFAMDMFSGGLAGFTTTPTLPVVHFTNTPSGDPTHPSTYDLQQSAKDDISNHNLQSTSAIGGSG